jgi:hypothetical protein
VVGDYYAAEWVTSAWRRENIAYIQSKLNASQLYIEALPAFTRGLVSLPDHPTLLRELRLLERSPTRMGKELVTHPRGCHDDHANSCCAVLHNLSSGVGYDLETLRRAFSTDDNPDPEAQRRVRDQQYRNEFAMRIFQLSGGTLSRYLSGCDRWYSNLRWQVINDRAGGICERCHKDSATQVHHLCYPRGCREQARDLLAVCDLCIISCTSRRQPMTTSPS